MSLLHEAPDMPEQQKEKYIKVALNKAGRLEKLINELFEITKYNAHTVIIKKETVDLHCLIAQVIDEIYPTLSANGNTAVFTAEDNLSVNADPEKLARVFSNLLRNAASYSYPQTEITISAKRLEHDIQITFENRGKTIPQEHGKTGYGISSGGTPCTWNFSNFISTGEYGYSNVQKDKESWKN